MPGTVGSARTRRLSWNDRPGHTGLEALSFFSQTRSFSMISFTRSREARRSFSQRYRSSLQPA